MTQKKTLAISIVTWNSENEILECLENLQPLPADWEIWVADNLSSDNTVRAIRENFTHVNVIENKDNLGFAAGNNRIFERTDSDFVLLLNPDTIVSIEAVRAALEEIDSRPKVGVLGIQVTNEDEQVQHSCFSFPTVSRDLIESIGLYRFVSDEWKEQKLASAFFDHRSERKADWVMGAFMLVRRDVIEKVGGLPEDYFMFTEEMDWCYRIWQAGYEILYTPKVKVIHKFNRSAGQLPSEWRIEKTTLGKYLFCYTHFGRLKTRLIQTANFIGLNLNIWRFSGSEEHAEQTLERKIYRKFVWKAIRSNKDGLRKTLQIR
jgi:N-acetylglucosaminyl-diphospho-decaprenol L-rhamnosyltransferase